MARTSSNDAAKASAPAAAETAAATTSQAAADNAAAPEPTANAADAAGIADSNTAAGNQSGPVLPTEPANGIGSTAQAGQTTAVSGVTATDAATAGPSTSSPDATSVTGDQAQEAFDADDNGEITIYPLRSYLDGKEVRRAGGKSYKSPKHDAVSLIAAGLATDKKPKA